MSTPIQIGFSQRIRLEWLEHTAALALAGATRSDIAAALSDLLGERLSVGSTAQRGNREKAIGILLSTWVTVPGRLEGLRQEGLAHLRRLPPEQHLALHWGMAMAAYPFFGTVAEVAGRLLRLQGSVAAAQAQRRLREQLGERETVSRAARRILRCFVDWDVLRDTERKGVYLAAPLRPLPDAPLAAWLVEAALRASGASSAPLAALAQSPALFPFTLGAPNGAIRTSERLELLRQGLDQDVVALRGNGTYELYNPRVHPRVRE